MTWHTVFIALSAFIGWYPIVYSVFSLNSSRQFSLDRKGIATSRTEPSPDDLAAARKAWPVLAIGIAALNEEAHIESVIRMARRIDWPRLEIWVVDDGSTDGTREKLWPFAERGEINLILKDKNEGKATALNDVAERTSAEIFLVLDADAQPSHNLATLMVPQLWHHPDLAAITGNPRVLTVRTMLEKLQAIEFSSTVATQRRGHGAWGRIATMSGICTMFRTKDFREVGAFDPNQLTEDIELTWRIHVNGLRVGFEPHAIVGMHVPPTFTPWLRQRERWAGGLVMALRRHARDIVRRRNMAIWPLAVEAVTSLIWCHTLLFVWIFWLVAVLSGNPQSWFPFLGVQSALAILVAMVQVMWGIHLDSADDPSILDLRPFAPWFPLAYWLLLSLAVVLSTIPAMRRPLDRRVTWVVHR